MERNLFVIGIDDFDLQQLCAIRNNAIRHWFSRRMSKDATTGLGIVLAALARCAALIVCTLLLVGSVQCPHRAPSKPGDRGQTIGQGASGLAAQLGNDRPQHPLTHLGGQRIRPGRARQRRARNGIDIQMQQLLDLLA